jgi:hypothetical protein
MVANSIRASIINRIKAAAKKDIQRIPKLPDGSPVEHGLEEAGLPMSRVYLTPLKAARNIASLGRSMAKTPTKARSLAVSDQRPQVDPPPRQSEVRGYVVPAQTIAGWDEPEQADDGRPHGNGVWGHTNVFPGSGVLGTVSPEAKGSAAITGMGALAGRFIGNVTVSGDEKVDGSVEVGGIVHVQHGLTVGGNIDVVGDIRLAGADLAEEFSVVDVATPSPGMVMVIEPTGTLRPSNRPYDRTVAGVVSGAGRHRPALVLDGDGGGDGEERAVLGLVGKVGCLVDATYGPILPGDLLTTSATRGHAMKVQDHAAATGAILGKALEPLSDGTAVISILVALQ